MMNKKFKRPTMPTKGPNAVWILLFFLGLGVVYLFWYNSANREVEHVSYSQLLENVSQDKVKSIEVQDYTAQGKLKDGRTFTANVVPITRFWDALFDHKVEVDVFPPEKQSTLSYLFFSFLPLIFIFGFFYFRQSQNGGGGGSGKIFSVGKSKAKLFSPNQMTVTFKDVAGADEAKADLQEIVEFLKNPKKFDRLGAKIPRGVLLSGAPGNGKTMLAKAVAGEASCPFLSISGSDFVEVFVGVGASRVRDLFAQARKQAPCIVFIDEIDAVGRQRGTGIGGGNDEREQTLNQLLTELDGFSTEHGSVIVLAATNRPDVLDKALLRPGRFDRNIEVPYPDVASREAILRVHVRNVKLDAAIDLAKIARGTSGFTGADLANLINEAALVALKNDSEAVEMHHFEVARDKILVGSERKTLIFTPLEKKMTAYHEAGHSLLNLLLPETDPFHKVTIVPRGRALGVSWSLPERDSLSKTKTQLTQRIMVCMGGLLAEKIVFNEQTTGVSNDLSKATSIARKMVRSYGMSPLGPIEFDVDSETSFLGRESSKEFSEKTAELIDIEVAKIVNDCYAKGFELLTQNRDKLNLLAETLVEKETLQAAQVYELLGLTPRESHSLN
jgi:cell division protease FtsH